MTMILKILDAGNLADSRPLQSPAPCRNFQKFKRLEPCSWQRFWRPPNAMLLRWNDSPRSRKHSIRTFSFQTICLLSRNLSQPTAFGGKDGRLVALVKAQQAIRLWTLRDNAHNSSSQHLYVDFSCCSSLQSTVALASLRSQPSFAP